MNFTQSLGSSWNGYVGALETSSKFESMLGRAQAEQLRWSSKTCGRLHAKVKES
uniref:Uncharacterized protein n=1 Tax=Hyaloperonospora arabidopsidis (strain Emoy2) TaxID=559515 RepID=M4C0B6_HYAAE